MLRVLQMIGGLNIGGAQSLVMNLYEAIDREAVQFDFIIDEPEHTTFAEKVRSMGGNIYVLPKFNGKNLMAVRRAWDQFFRDHRGYRILHSHVRSYASLYLPIAKKHGLQTIIHSHNTSNGQGIAAVGKAMLQYPLRFQADYFFACSDAAGEWLFGKKTLSKKNFHVLQNAVDIEKYRFNPNTRLQIRKDFGVTNSTTVYGHIGRLTEAKNHSFLLDVFREIHTQKSDSVLLIVGDGELHVSIEERVHDLDLTDSVKLLGARSDPEKLLQAMDCFLFPSKWEGLPLSVVEAQAAGLPCFVSDAVTKEVDLSELITYLPIDHGPEVWTNAVCAASLERKDVGKKIADAGFDVHKQAEWIKNFYLSVSEGCHGA